MPKNVNEVLTIYRTCFKICKNCSNIQCNSCKKKTKTAFSNVSKVHYGLDISESEITLANLPSSHRSQTAVKTVLGSTKNKSPSTLRRDRERLNNFITKKRLLV